MTSNSRRPPKTAAELMAELNQDPAYRARTAERERFRERSRQLNRAAAEPLLADLRAAGFQVDSVAELHHRRLDYRRAIPILMEWLGRMENDDVLEDIVRALTVEWAKPDAARPLLKQLESADDDSLRWAIANALSVVADDSVFAEVAAAARLPANGQTREMLTLALGNMDAARAIPVLLELLEDQQTVGHAAMALGRLRAVDARDRLKALLDHDKPWIAAEAWKALKRIEA